MSVTKPSYTEEQLKALVHCSSYSVNTRLPFILIVDVLKFTMGTGSHTPLGSFNETYNHRYAPEKTCRSVVSLRTVIVSFAAGTAPISIIPTYNGCAKRHTVNFYIVHDLFINCLSFFNFVILPKFNRKILLPEWFESPKIFLVTSLGNKKTPVIDLS